MFLYANGHLIGQVTDYFYETPWGNGRLHPCDPQQFQTFCMVSLLLANLDDLPDDDHAYETTLKQYQIDQTDIDYFNHAKWVMHPLLQTLALYECTPDGWLRWRWYE